MLARSIGFGHTIRRGVGWRKLIVINISEADDFKKP
jgi:hypothetical protein